MKLKKSSALLVVIIMIATLLFGCGAATPSSIIIANFEDLRDEKELKGIIDESLQDAGLAESDSLVEKLTQAMLKLEYEIVDEKIDGNIATVDVKVKGIDFMTIMESVMTEAMDIALARALDGEEFGEEQANALVIELFAKYIDETEFSERDVVFEMEKVNGNWEIKDEETIVPYVLFGMEGF